MILLNSRSVAYQHLVQQHFQVTCLACLQSCEKSEKEKKSPSWQEVFIVSVYHTGAEIGIVGLLFYAL